MRYLFLIFALAGAAPAAAEIVDAGATGMEIIHSQRIAANPQTVWAMLVQPRRWWSAAHTFSGSASNLTLDAKPGGCWCETLPDGGGVRHMTVGFIAPAKTLVLRGALGPFYNMGVDGAMTWALIAAGTETEVAVTYRVGGYVKEGFGKWAQPVDGVLGEQIARLKQAVEAKP
jgi:uncharacterized protein YndB with AHSA1/START domain